MAIRLYNAKKKRREETTCFAYEQVPIRQLSLFTKFIASTSFDVLCPNLLDRKTPFDYAQEEASFHVDELISALADKQLVEVHQYNGQHGFSDPFSAKYNEASTKKAWDPMLNFLRKYDDLFIS